MGIDHDSFVKSWDAHIKELIQTSAKQSARIELKHDQIVEGAAKIFLEKGFHPTTIREIADAAGMSLGQLYHYVSSKDDILLLLHRKLEIMFSEYLEQQPIDDEDAVITLIKALRQCQKFMATNRRLIQFIYRESKYLSKQHLEVVLQMDDRNIVERWRRLIEDVKRQKMVDIDTNFAANVVAYLSTFIPMRGWNLRDRPDSEQQEVLIEYILQAIGVEPPVKEI